MWDFLKSAYNYIFEILHDIVANQIFGRTKANKVLLKFLYLQNAHFINLNIYRNKVAGGMQVD